ncbi:MAG: hypothetical protein HY756_04960 [Nitrospirae bacterium]|nr:hypothetical protein [Nitrospirota bacterium]
MGILIKAIRKKIINNKEADKILESMVNFGFYSPVNSIVKLL